MMRLLRLLTEPEYQDAMRRIEGLMDAKTEPELSELDILADHVVAYEALDDATDALITHFRAHTATRKDPKLRQVYRGRAEIVIRAWMAAITSQAKVPALSSGAPSEQDLQGE